MSKGITEEDPIPIEKPKVEPVGDETATSVEDLRVNKIDPAGKIDPLTGDKQFLAWTTVVEDGEEIQKAVSQDGTVYKIVEDKPPVVKNYKLIIAEETETPNNIDPHPIDIQNVDSGKIEDEVDE